MIGVIFIFGFCIESRFVSYVEMKRSISWIQLTFFLLLSTRDVVSLANLNIPGWEGSVAQARGIINLKHMIECVNDCGSWSYMYHGCYCGPRPGGQGSIDKVDNCCFKHDRCYENSSCATQLLQYLTIYDNWWECDTERNPTCLFTDEVSCRHDLCKCDVAFTRCIKKFPCIVNKEPCPPISRGLYSTWWRGPSTGKGKFNYTRTNNIDDLLPSK